MTEIHINDDTAEADDVIEAAEVETVAVVNETAGIQQGVLLGQLLASIDAITARLEATEQAIQAAANQQADKLQELLDDLNAIEDAEQIEAAVEVAEAETLNDLTEAVTLEAEAEAAEVVEEMGEADEVTPGSRRTHWYYRPAHEWRRD